MRKMRKGRISIVEDHHEALGIWRKNKFKNIDLVHLDAHVDFAFYPAYPKKQVIKESKSFKALKQNMERSILYSKYKKDFGGQTHIGNYIYPAMAEGIVKDFYWIVPGGLKEFRQSKAHIKRLINSIKRRDPWPVKNAKSRILYEKNGIISTQIFGRKFIICALERMPILKRKVLLDIDVDFLVTDSILEARNTIKVGQRKPWISPEVLVSELLLARKVKPAFITIAYSVNGGYTPMRYKILGDELAFYFSPRHFRSRYKKNLEASFWFVDFQLSGRKKSYQKAVRLNPSYGSGDNNYGPMYLTMGKFSKAEKEFSKISRVDPGNPYPFLGLGAIALKKRDFYGAKRNFTAALRFKKDLSAALFGLGQAEFKLKNFKKAKKIFHKYKLLDPFMPQSYYYLGRIYEREKDFKKAITHYQDALSLGLNDLSLLLRIIMLSYHSEDRDSIMRYCQKMQYMRVKPWLKKKDEWGERIKGLQGIRKKMAIIDKKLKEEGFSL